jgi:hypothetical protein
MPQLVLASILIIAGAGFTVGLPIGLAVALVLTLLYVGSTARKKGERRRRMELAITSAVAGPMVGALIAGVEVARGDVIPVFVGETYGQYAGMGLFVGVLVGLAFLMTAALAPGEAGKPPGDAEL